MPGSVLPNMSIVLPSLGGDAGIWDDEINAALTILDAHDHTSGKGPRVPTAGLNINADLTFAGFTATNLGKIAFSTIAAPSSGSKNLFVNTADNELYWRTNGGTNVKLTNGTSINTTLVGGIVGDYSSVGAEVAYDDANDRYTFKQQGTKPWARIACGPVRIFEFNTTESVFVELAVAAALGASYTVTYPAALPGSTSLVTIDSSGNLIYTRSPTIDNLTVATGGAVTLSGTTTISVGGTSTLTGAVTASSSVTAASFTSTGQRLILISPAAFETCSTGPTQLSTTKCNWPVGTTTGRLYIPLTLTDLETIVSWRLRVIKNSAAGTISCRLFKYDSSTDTETALGTNSQNSGVSPGEVTLANSGLTVGPIGNGAHESYYLAFTGGGTTGDTVCGAEVSVTGNV